MIKHFINLKIIRISEIMLHLENDNNQYLQFTRRSICFTILLLKR